MWRERCKQKKHIKIFDKTQSSFYEAAKQRRRTHIMQQKEMTIMDMNRAIIQIDTKCRGVRRCLYIACRADGNAPYLLIDFSDAIQTNMYTLGQVYMHIVQKLFLSQFIPLIDPCLFVRKFCDKLDFGR